MNSAFKSNSKISKNCTFLNNLQYFRVQKPECAIFFFNMKSKFLLVLEWTPKYRTSNTPNIELSEHHILAQNQTLNMSNITNVPRLVWSHNNRTELRTLLNITFWLKTELRTCWTSQKKGTVCEHRINCSFQD